MHGDWIDSEYQVDETTDVQFVVPNLAADTAASVTVHCCPRPIGSHPARHRMGR